jgi:hypothetical protein
MKRKINPLNNKITFINDDPKAPSPNLVVSEKLAQLIEGAVNTTQLSININSTTGGKHSTKSFHYHGMAVDINLIAGMRVDDIKNANNVRRFQSIIAASPVVAECFGPFINSRKQGTNVTLKPNLRASHLDHLHISSQG